MDQENWEPFERGREIRSVGLGSVMALTPSGKYYMPFACGNLSMCPVCEGTGTVKPSASRRLVNKRRNREIRSRDLWVKRYGPALHWPAHILARSARLSSLMRQIGVLCSRCGGLGSHEAYDDELWNADAVAALNAVGLSMETSEGDGTYLLAVEIRDVDRYANENNEAEEEE